MSRRKQSNPKPLKGGEEEEWESKTRAQEAPSPSPAPAPSPAPPKLRLNASLATDPALRPSAAAPSPPTQPPASPGPPPHDYPPLATLPTAIQSAIVAGRLFCVPPPDPVPATAATTRKQEADKQAASSGVASGGGGSGGAVYYCSPCSIKFSSLSTLEAHQTYYCSHRQTSQTKGMPVTVGGVDSEPEDIKPEGREGRDEVSGGESSCGEPAVKSARTGKQYRCPHCSYSADKKVSLNRHMRMHASSPASQSGTGDSEPAHPVDRYCQDCDIRFSSLKTFKAHKMHYCSTRHVIKTKPPSAPSSPSESRTTPPSPGASDTSREPPQPQPVLALPTNPILIVPYSLFQGASILSGPAVMGLPSQDTACLLMPDGSLQPLAQGLLHPSLVPPQRSSQPHDAKRSRHHHPHHDSPKHPEEARKNGLGETSGAPLDLSVRTRDEEGELVIDTEEEDEKENRRSVDNQPNIFPSPDPEDIICAPTIHLMLSTSSTCSSPSPAPPSPVLSTSPHTTGTKRQHEAKRQRTDSHCSSPSPKSSHSDAKSPRRTPNGLPNLEKIKTEPKRKNSADSSPPKIDTSNNNITLSSLLLAAAHSQIDRYPGKSEMAGLPYPPELVSNLVGARLPGGKGKSIPVMPGLIPAAARNLPVLLPKPPRTPADLMNPASILPLLTTEMALRIAAASGAESGAPPPQVLVKQGVSKCQECNIVFCKHENYIAHKKHYCSARLNETVVIQDDDKPDSPTVSASPPNTASSPSSQKDSHSPGSHSAPPPSTPKPTLYQFICAACGIKFTSYDNLTAHQAYYCPKRSSTESDKGSRRCQKCKMTVPMDHVCGSASGAWKCPCCPVISPTASAAQKHMDTHSGVKAFLCTICSYKGNTLRGMRTHIRMHFDKRSSEIMEENYISCVVEDGSGGCVEVPVGEPDIPPPPPPALTPRAVNGVKQEPEEDEEYIEVEEVNIKTEPMQEECDTKPTVMRRGEAVLPNVGRGVKVQR